MEEKIKNEEEVIPVFAEELTVSKRQVSTERGVRIHKTVTEKEQLVDQPLLYESAEVTRVAVNKMVDSAPPVRHEGDLMIVPVLEEQLFVEKRLFLKEEIHIRKTRETVRQPQKATLREEHVQVERFGQHSEEVVESPRPPAGGSVLDRVFPTRRNS
ncbi:MAG: YsnF/AvaK domain-containing protein [Acidobacteriota bacterium]|nr:YsnF/AvaK domain-containing protein [Acidobacteriota bacterium]